MSRVITKAPLYKYLIYLVLIVFYLSSFDASLIGQKREVDEIKYKRSSLHFVLIDTDDFPNKDTVFLSFKKYPFPDKYNDHRIDEALVNLNDFKLTDGERKELESAKSTLQKVGKSTLQEVGFEDLSGVPYQIEKYIKESKLGNKLIAKWFNRNESNGSFNTLLVQERGLYNVNQQDIDKASRSTKAEAKRITQDSGEDLIGNTFVVFNKMNFVSNEVVAKIAYEIALEKIRSSKKLAKLQEVAEIAALKAYKKASEGYSVWTTAFLYRLKYDEAKINTFYSQYWISKDSPDEERKKRFEEVDNLFELEFVGKEKATSLVTFSLKEERTKEQVIRIATIRNLDRVIAKLQREYDVFKTKTPLLSGKPPTAFIGLKEGLEDGDRYEVLEQILDGNKTVYRKIATIKVDEDKIWDNRYSAGEGPQDQSVSQRMDALDRTHFKGKVKKYRSGLLIRQVK